MNSILEGPNPSLIVLDCDHTIWPFDCNKDVLPPFTKSLWGGVWDCYGRPADPYLEVPDIVLAIVKAGIPVAYASRNPSTDDIEELLIRIEISPELSLWDAMPSYDYFHVYSSGGYGRGKAKHFDAIQKATGIAYENMLFFDDLPDNIVHAKAMGITSVLVNEKTGLNWDAMRVGLLEFRQKKE